MIRGGLPEKTQAPLLFMDHHESHAASAFFPSPFDEAAVLTLDGVGEWTTASWGVGRGNKLDLRQHLQFPHSLGLLYSAFTYYCGFKVNSGEYKLMGLAPYGTPTHAKAILEHLNLKEEDRIKPEITSSQVIRNITDYHTQLINRTRHGDMIIPGQSLYVLEVAPAGYAAIAANEAEKAANINILEVRAFGSFGRVYLGGEERDIDVGYRAAEQAIESIAGELLHDVVDGATPTRLYTCHQLAWYARRVDAAREQLEADCASPHSLTSLARSAGMSPFHFARVFRELTDVPPHRYLVAVRLRAAVERLRQGESVTDTCFAVGFNSLGHFIEMFRRTYGVSPSRFH